MLLRMELLVALNQVALNNDTRATIAILAIGAQLAVINGIIRGTDVVDGVLKIPAIAVRDEGAGIPAAHQERIFERFFSYRPEGTRADRPHAGLGLAIVKAIVEGYGGRVTVANNSDRGATFTVWLPASRTGTFAQVRAWR